MHTSRQRVFLMILWRLSKKMRIIISLFYHKITVFLRKMVVKHLYHKFIVKNATRMKYIMHRLEEKYELKKYIAKNMNYITKKKSLWPYYSLFYAVLHKNKSHRSFPLPVCWIIFRIFQCDVQSMHSWLQKIMNMHLYIDFERKKFS